MGIYINYIREFRAVIMPRVNILISEFDSSCIDREGERLWKGMN